MKILFIVLSRIAQYFKETKTVFILFLSGNVICGLAFMYTYGNAVSYIYKRDTQDVLYRKYVVEAKGSDNIKIDTSVLKFIDKDDIEEAAIGTLLDKGSETKKYVLGMYKNAPIRLTAMGRGTFNKNEFKNGENVVTLSVAEGSPVGSSVYMFDHEFKIIGRTHSTSSEYCIPYNTYKKLNLQTDMLIITSVKRSDINNDKFYERLQSLFPNATVSQPEYALSDMERASGEMLSVCILYALALVSFLFLIKYMVNINIEENIIYTVTGASKGTVMSIIYLEITALIIISSILSIALYQILSIWVFAESNIWGVARFYFNDYIIIFALMLFVSLLTATPFILSLYLNTINRLKSKYL